MKKVGNWRFLAIGASLCCVSLVALFGEAQARVNGQDSDGEAKAIAVEVVKPARRTITRDLKIPASLRADELVDLFAKTSGYVGKIDVDIGSRVAKGDVLVELSVPEMADELHQAEALLEAKQAKVRALKAKSSQAQRMVETARAEVQRYAAERDLTMLTFKRNQQLHEGNAIPQQRLDEARSAMAVSQAQWQIAQAKVAGTQAEKQAVDADGEVAVADVQLANAQMARLKTLMEYAVIKAPFAGVITQRHVDHGAFVRSAAEGTTTPLLRIAKTDRIRLLVDIPEVDVRYVHVGTQVEIDVKALDEPAFSGAVARTADALNPETRTMRVEVDLDNSDGKLKAGMYAETVVKLESIKSAMVIPSKAIRVVGKQTVVLVASDGLAESKPIKIGYDDGIWAEILSGLDGQESVITSTGGSVSAGVAVSPVASGS